MLNIDEPKTRAERFLSDEWQTRQDGRNLANDVIDLCYEVERLQNIVDVYAASARTTALYLQPFCDGSIPYADMIADASRKADKRITELEKEIAVLKRALELACNELKLSSVEKVFAPDYFIQQAQEQDGKK